MSFAHRAGLNDRTLGTYLDGREPPRAAIVKIARAAKVPVGWLASGHADELDVDRMLSCLADLNEQVARLAAAGEPPPFRKRAELLIKLYEIATREAEEKIAPAHLPDDAKSD